MSGRDAAAGAELTAAAARAVAAGIVDPELRVVTIEELGILREVTVAGRRAVVTITPTYSGCPAMDQIRADVTRALRRAGWAEVEVVTELDPAWSTDLITVAGRAKLAGAGIAPPGRRAASPDEDLVPPGVRLLPVAGTTDGPVCPRCGSAATEQISRFGATACTAVWRCRACAEPFAHLRAI